MRRGTLATVCKQRSRATVWMMTGAHAPRKRSAKMKVVFLDIDGVLNCKATRNTRKLPYVVDAKLLKRFHRLLERTRAKVVLSSTWRYDPAGLFSAKHWGIPFIGVTPDMPNKPRRNEILAWLKTHPGVSRYVVIDDEDAPMYRRERMPEIGHAAMVARRRCKSVGIDRSRRLILRARIGRAAVSFAFRDPACRLRPPRNGD
jgi:hypothetical protein